MNMRFKNNPLVWVLAIVLVSLIAFQLGKKRGAEEAKQPVEKKIDVPSEAGTKGGRTVSPSTQGSESEGDISSDSLLIAQTKGMPEQILVRTGYITSYNKDTRCPNWTAWRLTSDHTSGPYKRKGVSFHEDDEVPFPKAQNADYQRSGYDRGHMCPSGDNKWSQQAQEDCFLFTNMCPQSHDLNSGDWNDLEQKCRKWAEREGSIYIVCGPVFRQKKTIGRSKVAVPDGFYKVVLCMNGTPKAIGFYYDNEDGRRPMSAYVHTVDDIERMTGIDFFASLPDAIENRVEAYADAKEWGIRK
jgi:endonuclease G